MRAARLAAALAVSSMSLSGCYFLDYALFGPGLYDNGHRGHHRKHHRHKRDRHDRGDREDRGRR